jgi:uncharacterized DUF497 family protein
VGRREALANEAKHGVSFEDGALACEDPLSLEVPDLLDAARTLTVGMSPAGVLVVVTTEVGVRTRIISARPVTPAERRNYEGRTP